MALKELIKALKKHYDDEELRRFLIEIDPDKAALRGLKAFLDEHIETIAEVGKSVLDDTLPTLGLLDALKLVLNFLREKSYAVIPLKEPYGTGKSHVLAVIREVLESDDLSVLKDRASLWVSKISRYLERGASDEGIKDKLREIKKALEELSIPSAKPEVIVVALGPKDIVDLSKPMYKIITERLGLNVDNHLVAADAIAAKAASRDALIAIIIDELQQRYVEKTPRDDVDKEFFKVLAQQKRILLAVAMNPLSGERGEFLNELYETFTRGSARISVKAPLREILLLEFINEGEHKEVERVSLASLDRFLFKRLKENVLREVFRYGKLRLAAYLAINAERPLFSGLFPIYVLKDILKDIELAQAISYEEALRFLGAILEEDEERMLAKALLLSTELRLPQASLTKVLGERALRSILNRRGYLFAQEGEYIALKAFWELLEHRVRLLLENIARCLHDDLDCEEAYESLINMASKGKEEAVEALEEGIRALMKDLNAIEVERVEDASGFKIVIEKDLDKFKKELLRRVYERVQSEMYRGKVGVKDLRKIFKDVLKSLREDAKEFITIIRKHSGEVLRGSYTKYYEFLKSYKAEIEEKIARAAKQLQPGEYSIIEFLSSLRSKLQIDEPLDRLYDEKKIKRILGGIRNIRVERGKIVVGTQEEVEKEMLKRRLSKLSKVRELDAMKVRETLEKARLPEEEKLMTLYETVKDRYIYGLSGDRFVVYDLDKIYEAGKGFKIADLSTIVRRFLETLRKQGTLEEPIKGDVNELTEKLLKFIEAPPKVKSEIKNMIKKELSKRVQKEKPKKRKIITLKIRGPEEVLKRIVEEIVRKYGNSVEVYEERISAFITH